MDGKSRLKVDGRIAFSDGWQLPLPSLESATFQMRCDAFFAASAVSDWPLPSLGNISSLDRLFGTAAAAACTALGDESGRGSYIRSRHAEPGARLVGHVRPSAVSALKLAGRPNSAQRAQQSSCLEAR